MEVLHEVRDLWTLGPVLLYGFEFLGFNLQKVKPVHPYGTSLKQTWFTRLKRLTPAVVWTGTRENCHPCFCRVWRDGWNPANSPVEVGSCFPIIYKGFSTIQTVVGLGLSEPSTIVLYQQVVLTSSIHCSKYPQAKGVCWCGFKVVQRYHFTILSLVWTPPTTNLGQWFRKHPSFRIWPTSKNVSSTFTSEA